MTGPVGIYLAQCVLMFCVGYTAGILQRWTAKLAQASID